MTKQAQALTHADWCTEARIETTEYPDHGITTTRCLDCGGYLAHDRAGKSVTTPAVTGAFAGLREDDADLMRSTSTSGGAA